MSLYNNDNSFVVVASAGTSPHSPVIWNIKLTEHHRNGWPAAVAFSSHLQHKTKKPLVDTMAYYVIHSSIILPFRLEAETRVLRGCCVTIMHVMTSQHYCVTCIKTQNKDKTKCSHFGNKIKYLFLLKRKGICVNWRILQSSSET